MSAAEVTATHEGANDGSESEESVGPMPMNKLPAAGSQERKRKRKVVPHERLYMDRLPSADRYYRSFMHRDTVSWITVTKTNFIITASTDGHLKFWKKKEPSAGPGIEFVKHYRAHLTPILSVSSSADGLIYGTVAADEVGTSKGSLKVFDVQNFDMINLLKLSFTPKCCCWIHRFGQAASMIAISDAHTGAIHVFDGRGGSEPLFSITSLHQSSVHLLAYNPQYNCVISADVSGLVEYWEPSVAAEHPACLDWTLKSQTDLFEFKKAKNAPSSLTISPSGEYFATSSLSANDRQIRIFSFLSAKLLRKYDESLTAITEMQQAGTAAYRMDDMEFGRRLAVDRELEKTAEYGLGAGGCVLFDESGNFVMYATLLGIKVVNFRNNKIVRVLGKGENARFLQLALFQGGQLQKTHSTIASMASNNPLLQGEHVPDPTLFCTAFKRTRFYFFNRIEPESEAGSKNTERDVFNEKPTREEQAIAAPASVAKASISHSAVIHTTAGDIHCKLFPELAPKTVENFVGHSRSGYYDAVIFHRVIQKFMIQTGDPLGDGTGGESIWGGTFEDEFHSSLRHDRPYCLSMANAGPKTNGSQFFITTVPCAWLDNKHTIFGRCLAGLDVVHHIENLRCDKSDKPMPDYEVKITSITIE